MFINLEHTYRLRNNLHKVQCTLIIEDGRAKSFQFLNASKQKDLKRIAKVTYA